MIPIPCHSPLATIPWPLPLLHLPLIYVPLPFRNARSNDITEIMRNKLLLRAIGLAILLCDENAIAHEWHRHEDLQSQHQPAHAALIGDLAQIASCAPPVVPAITTPNAAVKLATAAFGSFKPAVHFHWDAEYFYVESDGMPSHKMMAGITSWQQQVPLPQNYSGANAWRFPLRPVVAPNPYIIDANTFTRGAIAIAVNGVPIFNPYNNRGELSALIGELDKWGGHCGRADDYHYHVSPLHLGSEY
jgi:hypothetical protein